MGINPSFAIGLDAYFGNGAYNPAINKVDFFIAKASEGTAKDPRFQEYRSVCAAAGIVFMAYHYYRTSVPWKQQADNFLQQANADNVSMLFWDYEQKHNTLNPKTAADTVAAMSYLKQVTGKPVGLYADRQRTFEIYRDAPQSKIFPLWIAQYPTNQANFEATPNIQPKFTPQFKTPIDWRIWQFASELNWGNNLGHEYGLESHSVDLNAWNGTPAEMRAYLGLFGGNNGTPDPSLTVEQRLEKLESEARNHGWNIS